MTIVIIVGLGAAVNVDPKESVATAEMLFHNCLWEGNAIGLQYHSFNVKYPRSPPAACDG